MSERRLSGAGTEVRIQFPPAERCYGAGDKEMAPSSLRMKLMERLMPQPNDLSRSLAALDHDSTIIAVVEMTADRQACRARVKEYIGPPMPFGNAAAGALYSLSA